MSTFDGTGFSDVVEKLDGDEHPNCEDEALSVSQNKVEAHVELFLISAFESKGDSDGEDDNTDDGDEDDFDEGKEYDDGDDEDKEENGDEDGDGKNCRFELLLSCFFKSLSLKSGSRLSSGIEIVKGPKICSLNNFLFFMPVSEIIKKTSLNAFLIKLILFIIIFNSNLLIILS